MEIVDANILLRYLLGDNLKMKDLACQVIDNTEVLILSEVLAEVVYVLEKVYKVPRTDISKTLLLLLDKPTIIMEHFEIISNALIYYQQFKLDFIDCILLSYSKSNGSIIHTFDKKLSKLIESIKL